MMFLMFAITTLLAGQVVEFNDPQYAEVYGTPQEIIEFYEDWRNAVHPNWRTSNMREFWMKERDRVEVDAKYHRRLFYAYPRQIRPAFWSTILCRDCTVWFRVRVDPFGTCHIPYKPRWHAILSGLGLILMAIVIWYRRQIRHWLIRRLSD